MVWNVLIGLVNVYSVKMRNNIKVGFVVIIMNIRRIKRRFINGILLC